MKCLWYFKLYYALFALPNCNLGCPRPSGHIILTPCTSTTTAAKAVKKILTDALNMQNFYHWWFFIVTLFLCLLDILLFSLSSAGSSRSGCVIMACVGRGTVRGVVKGAGITSIIDTLGGRNLPSSLPNSIKKLCKIKTNCHCHHHYLLAKIKL